MPNQGEYNNNRPEMPTSHSPWMQPLHNDRNINPNYPNYFTTDIGKRRQEVEIICLDLLRRFQLSCRYLILSILRFYFTPLYYTCVNLSTNSISFYFLSFHPRRSVYTWLSITEGAASAGIRYPTSFILIK